MSRHRHNHGSDLSRSHHDHVPYWKRAHTDWRFYDGVLMLAAMIAYVLSDDLAWGPSTDRNRHRPAKSENNREPRLTSV